MDIQKNGNNAFFVSNDEIFSAVTGRIAKNITYTDDGAIVSDATTGREEFFIPDFKQSGGSADTSDATAIPSDVSAGVTFYGSDGKKTGTMPDVTATASDNVVLVPAGRVRSEQKVNVGTAKGAATYTPSTEEQTIPSGTYLSGKQTIKGDSDLTAGNIKSGVSIFGVGGTFTSDADATASDIASGKIAYVKGEQVVGTAAMASGYNKRGILDNVHMVQILDTTAHIPTPSQRAGSLHLHDGTVYYLSGSTNVKEQTPVGDIQYFVCGCWPNESHGYGISGGKVYRFYYDPRQIDGKWVYAVYSNIASPGLTEVEELVIANGDRFICRQGDTLYAGHSDGSKVLPVSGVSAARILNYDASDKATVITTSGDIARVEWWDEEPFADISETDRSNGNPFTNVNYQASDEFDVEGAAYMLAFRETGFWYKEIGWGDHQWVQASGVPDLIRTNWLGRCVTSMEESYSYDEETGEENWGYIIKQSEVALHIDTEGHLWKICAKCTADGDPDGLTFAQVGTDSDWTFVPSTVSSNRNVSSNTFAQKGGKLIRLITDGEPEMGITWEEYPFSPNGKMIASQDGNYIFSLENKTVDYTRAGGMI